LLRLCEAVLMDTTDFFCQLFLSNFNWKITRTTSLVLK